MTRKIIFENKAFKKIDKEKVGFNIISNVNSFNSFFEVKELEKEESEFIRFLLSENYFCHQFEEKIIEDDIIKIKKITAEIRAIGRQGILLMGERIYLVMNILKSYKKGTFTKWLESTFNTKKTGYNALAYFELYRTLSNKELKEKLSKIPLRAAYILASRPGNRNIKEDIIRDYYHLKHKNLVSLIKNKLPCSLQDKKSTNTSSDKIINQIFDLLLKIKENKENLLERNKENLLEIIEITNSIIL